MAPRSHGKSAITLIVGAVLVLSAACGRSGGPAIGGESGGRATGEGTLVLTTSRDSVVLIDPTDGSIQPTKLLSALDSDLVDMSADSRTLVSASTSGGLSVVTFDGADTHESAIPGTEAGCESAAMSPSGHRVLCINQDEIRVLSVDGKPLGDDLGLPDRDPSSGGSFEGAKFLGEDRVAYSISGYGAENSGLYLSSIDSGDAQQIARGHIGSFDTANDGLAIVFSVGESYTADKIAKYSPSSGETGTLFTPADGGENSHVWDLRFSPDDSTIAYDFGTLPRGTDGVYIMNADGSNRRRIVQSNGEFILPFAFSPNGTRLAVHVPSEITPMLGLSTGGFYLFDAGGSADANPTQPVINARGRLVAWVR